MNRGIIRIMFQVWMLYLLNFLQHASGQYFDSLEASHEMRVINDPEIRVADIVEPGCPKIYNLRNISISEIHGHWHLPYMSSHWFHEKVIYSGGKSKKLTYMGENCIKVNVKEIPRESESTEDNSDVTVWMQSKCPHNGAEWILRCVPNQELNSKWFCSEQDTKRSAIDHNLQKRNSFLYIVDMDSHNYSWALVLRCYSNIEMNWAIFSKVKTLDKTLVKSILGTVESLGFKLLNVVEVPFEKCTSGRISK